MTPFPTDQAQQLLAYLQAWRQYLEQSLGVVSPPQPNPWVALAPAAPLVPPPMPAAASIPAANPPTDYTQQLLAYLQAWRQYLEQAMGATPPPPACTPPPPACTPPPPACTPPPDVPTPPPDAPPPPRPPRPIPPTPPSQTLENQTLENVVPVRGFMSSQFALRHPVDEPSSVDVSLFDPSRSSFPLEVGEYQPNSAFGAPIVSSGAWAPAEPESLYSGPAAPTASATRKGTHRGHQGEAVSGNKPEELEIVRPLKDPGR